MISKTFLDNTLDRQEKTLDQTQWAISKHKDREHPNSVPCLIILNPTNQYPGFCSNNEFAFKLE
jgi:hypothetical protein